MKKLLLIITLTGLISNLNAQVNPDKQIQRPMTDFELGQYYNQKSKKLKNTGWTLLGVGAGLITTSIVVAANADYYNDAAFVFSSIAILAGTGSMIASIPVFVAGAKNKGRAEILLRHDNVPISMEKSRNIPLNSVGIGISIGK
jgi:hypothetical protein